MDVAIIKLLILVVIKYLFFSYYLVIIRCNSNLLNANQTDSSESNLKKTTTKEYKTANIYYR